MNFFPAEELIGQIVLLLDIVAVDLLVVAKGINVFDATWPPFVHLPVASGFTDFFSVVVFDPVENLALEGANGPDVLVSVVAFQVAAVLADQDALTTTRYPSTLGCDSIFSEKLPDVLGWVVVIPSVAKMVTINFVNIKLFSAIYQVFQQHLLMNAFSSGERRQGRNCKDLH